MVEYFLELEFFSLCSGLTLTLASRGIKLGVKESRTVFEPAASTEFDPLENIMLQVLALGCISDSDGCPVRSSKVDVVSHVLAIFTPASAPNRSSSISCQSIWIDEHLGTLMSIFLRNLVGIWLLYFVSNRLVLEARVVSKVVVIPMFAWNS